MKRKREDDDDAPLKKGRVCRFEDCVTESCYGHEGDRAIRCAKHKLPDMVDVRHKRCQQDGCDKRPTFAERGATKPAFCAKHIKGDMVNVNDKRCQQDGCDKQPSFAERGAKKPAFCVKHALCHMIDVKNKRCQQDGCDKLPTFAERGATKRAFCAEHIKGDMVNVKNKRCQQEGCDTRAWYGFLTFPAEYCAEHRHAEMVSNPTARCITKGCRNIATHGSASKRQHCDDHAQPGEIAFTKQLCLGPKKTGCGEMAVLSPHTQLCVACDPNYNMVKRVKHREVAVRGVLLQAGFTHFVYDKALPDNCGILSRPDFLFETPTHFVIVEVDEHQHKHLSCAGECTCSERLCSCEFTRMREIAFVLGLPTLFLRFNPDPYKAKTTKKIGQRHDHLVRVLRQSLQEIPTNPCEVKYLFYDEKFPPHQIVSN